MVVLGGSGPYPVPISDEGGNVLNIVNDGKFLLGACIDFFERSESLHIYLSIYQKGQWDVVAPETPLLGSAEGVKIDPVRVRTVSIKTFSATH